jgi:predicted nucleic acid-binding protein
LILIIDASVAIKWFAEEDEHEAAVALTDSPHKLIAPDLIFAEVANVLRRKARHGYISSDQAAAAVKNLGKAFGGVVPSSELVNEAFELAIRLDHSIYDVLYLACTLQAIDGVLITADEKFRAKADAAGFGRIVLSVGAAYQRFSTGQENENG